MNTNQYNSFGGVMELLDEVKRNALPTDVVIVVYSEKGPEQTNGVRECNMKIACHSDKKSLALFIHILAKSSGLDLSALVKAAEAGRFDDIEIECR